MNDIVAETGYINAKNSNNVEAEFDIVERIVQLVPHSTMLLGHCCWYRRGLKRAQKVLR